MFTAPLADLCLFLAGRDTYHEGSYFLTMKLGWLISLAISILGVWEDLLSLSIAALLILDSNISFMLIVMRLFCYVDFGSFVLGLSDR